MNAILLMLALSCSDATNAFETAEKAWRAERNANMKLETSWFAVIELYWLKEGQNTFGSEPGRDLVLPRHATVNEAGSFFLESGKLRYVMARGQRAVIDGKTANEGTLEQGQTLSHNHLRISLIERGGKLALRVRDLRTPNYTSFTGLNFFELDQTFVVEAQFVPFETPRKIAIDTVINVPTEMIAPGELRFTIQGQAMTLLATLEGAEDENFFIMFKDKTSGDSTYGAGRFMSVPRPVDGKTTINFNRATTPPCNYTDFATCPIPPKENHLPIAIEAGEKKYKDHEEP